MSLFCLVCFVECLFYAHLVVTYAFNVGSKKEALFADPTWFGRGGGISKYASHEVLVLVYFI